MSRKLFIVRRLLALGSAGALVGLMAGGCASGGEAQTTPSTGGSAGQDGGGGTSGSGFGGFGGSAGNTSGGTGGTAGTGAVDGGGTGGTTGDGGPDGSGTGGTGGLAGAGGTSGAGGSGGSGTGGCGSIKEICNGLDDNCDGQIDEGDPGGGDPCTVPNKQGVCKQGTKHCLTTGVIACVQDNQPSNEVCDGLDNNCDGQTDEGNPGGNTACNTGKPGICASGTTACTGGKVVCNQNYTALPAEKCNGADDNCDGQIDENNPGGGTTCNTGKSGVCAVGVTDCQNGQIKCVQQTTGSAEVCDGKDNDCDGTIDNNITSVACNSGDQGICAAGHTQCASGTESCIPDVTPGSQLEHCDGKDDDCDGTPDNDPVATMCGRDCPGNPTSFPHVNTIACNSACSIPAGGCEVGYHDDDGNYCNGCELKSCSQNPTINTCASAQTVAIPSTNTGQILTQGGSVWYSVSFSKPSPGSNFNPAIQLTQGSTEYRMDVLSNCSSPVTCPGNKGQLPSGSVTSGSNITNWSMNFASECQASTCRSDLSNVPGTLYVKITRTNVPGATGGNPDPECDQFTLAVSK